MKSLISALLKKLSYQVKYFQNENLFIESENDNSKKLDKEKLFLENGNISFIISKTEGIQNGDVLDVEIDYNKEIAKKLKIRPQNTKFKIKVEGLPTFAAKAEEVKDLKDYVTKLGQKKIEEELERYSNNNKQIRVSNIYYKTDENGNLIVKYFIQEVSNSFGITETFKAHGIGEFLLDKDKNIVYYAEIKPTGYFGETYRNIAEVEAAMSSEGYTKLD